jgi:hypothetical protein
VKLNARWYGHLEDNHMHCSLRETALTLACYRESGAKRVCETSEPNAGTCLLANTGSPRERQDGACVVHNSMISYRTRYFAMKMCSLRVNREGFQW